MSKRLVVCCDGTWNRRDQANPTNVAKVHASLAGQDGEGTRQIGRHVAGVGTAWGERIRGGMFGIGLSRGVVEAYRWIAANYEPGDELFLFGFSRGAYTARSAAGLIRNCGVVTEPTESTIQQAYSIYRSAEGVDGPRAAAFRTAEAHWPVPIRFIGVWDTVGSLGIPLFTNRVTEWINSRWGFHDTDLSSSVANAYHALAIDESRKPYAPTLWQAPVDAPTDQRVEQVWFAGAHSDVGGGFAQTGLSDLALLWMVERAEECGLAFADGAFAVGSDHPVAEASWTICPNSRGPLHNKPSGLFRFVPRAPRSTIGQIDRGHERLAESAVNRTRRDPSYRPANLLDAISRKVRQTPLPRRAATSHDPIR